MRVLAHDKGKLVKLFHDVDNAISKAGVLHPSIVIEFLPCLRNRRLVGAARHAHPPRQPSQFIDNVEALASAVDLKHHAGSPLRRSHRARVQRQPIDLILEGSGDTAVHLRADPDMALGPSGQVPQLLDLWVVLQCWVPHRQASGAKCPHFCAQDLEEPRALMRQLAREGSWSQGAVEDQDPRGMSEPGAWHLESCSCREVRSLFTAWI
mmetsp:Transcript_39029/g.91515  ORF Transcript_39029/g.91515 Transcript_39029/m.91515 type:complete len:209 (-) Transcript_39029:21-647(-)